MSCSHAASCPLFPLLKSSLQGWRDHYCDSDDRWNECARYQMSLTGERVPISLLPNGHHALHLASQANWSGRAEQKQQAPREAGERHQTPRRSPVSAADQQLQEDIRRFDASPPIPAAPRHQPPSDRTHLSEPQDSRPGRSRRAGRRRGLWSRLVDWMSGPS